ncbi:MAG: DUF4013 domain-containing protein [Anaerolineales bacterium]|nr:DUF4013 domain-containing protein [Anaerolineales bacterium]
MIDDQAFTFPFKDRKWGSKFVIGSLLILVGYVIPIIPLIFVAGYILRSMRHTVETGANSLPEWDDWADLGAKGILCAVLSFIYLLPGLALLAGAVVLFFLNIFLGMANINDIGWAVAFPVNLLAKLSLALSMMIAFVAVLLLMAGALLIPIALARLAASGELGAALEIGRIWAIVRAQFWDFVLVWALYYGSGSLAAMIFGILVNTVCCCVFVPIISAPISLYLMIFGMTLFARVYREGIGVTPDPPLLLPDKTAARGEITQNAVVEEEPRQAVSDQKKAEQEKSEESKEEDKGEEETESEATSPGGAEMKDLSQGTDVYSYELTLSELELPSRTERVLLENGFVTVGQILGALEKDEGELLSIKGFGTKSLENLKAQLTAKGFLS